MMWSNKMASSYIETAKYDRPNLFMDATGGCVRKVYDQKRDVYVVALVIQHPVRKQPQLPIALMLTNSYGTPDYTAFLHSWWHFMLTLNKNTRKPLSVTTDENWPSMHAVCLVFNGCDIIRYL